MYAVLITLSLYSCKKTELATQPTSPETYLQKTWVLESYYEQGASSDVIYDYTLDLKKDNKYTLTYTANYWNSPDQYSENGNWTYFKDNGKEYIEFTEEDPYFPKGKLDKLVKIQKLEKSKLWLEGYGGEYHLKN